MYYRANRKDILDRLHRKWIEDSDFRKRTSDRTNKWQKENPEKVRARSKLRYHVKVGNIEKQPCEICGDTENVQAHHEDYGKPLEVRWLCFKHHLAEHGKRPR